ncbi:hypothetical protein EK21DRAFT_84830 [Setomelanomma holmii]|uniref:Uncharacterized protein n=1 Tax=Setomelanomma holmii TaxID=210430 RepID=A0A9P4HKJ4_9PLEO|nr:hypothetical protein EK21DRAFT_84830 [Setomelanomma holmii]
MRYAFIGALAFCGLAIALPQDNSKAVATNDCSVLQPGGAGPVPGDGSVAAYLDSNNDLRKAALVKGSATNQGEYEEEFEVVIVGYSKPNPICKHAPSVPNFTAPTNLPAAINSPMIRKNGKDYDIYIDVNNSDNGPLDSPSAPPLAKLKLPTLKHTLMSMGHTGHNGIPLGTYCALYTRSWDERYAVNTEYMSGGNVYGVVYAASYSALVVVGGKKAVAGPSSTPKL